jgi:hypothetical protein
MTSTLANIVVRKADASDFDQIVDLQLRNLVTNLSEDQRKDGFLSGYFDAAMLAAANENLGVVVCADSDRVAGFICLTTPEFPLQNAVAAAMLEKIKNDNFFDKHFSEWVVCLCGPVCLDGEYRGIGLFERLYEEIPRFSHQCDLLVTLVAVANGRSIAAHRKAGMNEVMEFEWNERQFVVMAQKVQKRSHLQSPPSAYPKNG